MSQSDLYKKSDELIKEIKNNISKLYEILETIQSYREEEEKKEDNVSDRCSNRSPSR